MKHSDELIATLDRWASTRGLPSGFAVKVLETCPWLAWEETMSEALAPELLAEALSPYGLDRGAAESLCAAYNSYVERDFYDTVFARQVASAAMQAVLAEHGDVGLHGKFWLVEDSVSTSRPWVVVNDRAALSEPLMHRVAQAAVSCEAFTSVLFSDPSGDDAVEVPVGTSRA